METTYDENSDRAATLPDLISRWRFLCKEHNEILSRETRLPELKVKANETTLEVWRAAGGDTKTPEEQVKLRAQIADTPECQEVSQVEERRKRVETALGLLLRHSILFLTPLAVGSLGARFVLQQLNGLPTRGLGWLAENVIALLEGLMLAVRDSQEEQREFAPACENVEPGPSSPTRRKRGPAPKITESREVSEIVKLFGDAWREDSKLALIANQLDDAHISCPKNWSGRFPKSHTWARAVANYPRLVVQAIEYRLNAHKKHTS